jgi:hypothetical protein
MCGKNTRMWFNGKFVVLMTLWTFKCTLFLRKIAKEIIRKILEITLKMKRNGK